MEPPGRTEDMRGSSEATEGRAPVFCTVIRHVEIEDLGYLGQGLERNGIAFE